MKDFQVPQVHLGNQAVQEAIFTPKETQAQSASLGFQVVREVRASKDLLELGATQATQDQKVKEVLLVLGAM